MISFGSPTITVEARRRGSTPVSCRVAAVLGGFAFAVALLLRSEASDAQIKPQVPQGDTIATRPRPDYDALGLRAGSFLVLPRLSLQETYNSNIFATPANEQADAISTVLPSIDLRSDWNNHAVNLHADARAAKYLDNGSEDFVDRTFAIDGRLDVQRDARVFGAASYQVLHEPRSSPDNVAAADAPIEYALYGVRGGGERTFNRLGFRLDATADRYRYQDGQTSAGAPIDQSGRNRDQYDVRLRSAYELMPLRSVYLLTGYNRRSYEQSRDSNGFDRNSSGVTIGPGLRYDISGILLVDLFVGWRRQDIADPRLGTVNAAVAEARIAWNVTRLTTISGSLLRDLNETTVPNASSYIATRVELRADHELLRNLLLDARLGYEQDAFQGIERTDNYYIAGLGAKYLVNCVFSVSGGYGYRERDSDAAGTDFTEHTVSLRLNTQF